MVSYKKRREMDAYNRERRERRRIIHECEEEARTSYKRLPTMSELKDALRNATESHLSIIRLAALMDNLSLFESRRVLPGGGHVFGEKPQFKDRALGIRKFLEQDGYLLSRYSCLMRYKKLGELIRAKAKVGIETNLLWGLVPACPTDEHDDLYWHEDEWKMLHDLYVSFEGMNFKEINDKLKR